MIATGLIRDCIRESDKTPQIPSVIAAGTAQYGMQTFDQSLLQLYREELVTYETARDAATNPDDFDLKVKGIFSTGEMTWEHPGGSSTAATHTPPAQPASLTGSGATPGPAARSPFVKRA
jgi:twitching motility protein PilT